MENLLCSSGGAERTLGRRVLLAMVSFSIGAAACGGGSCGARQSSPPKSSTAAPRLVADDCPTGQAIFAPDGALAARCFPGGELRRLHPTDLTEAAPRVDPKRSTGKFGITPNGSTMMLLDPPDIILVGLSAPNEEQRVRNDDLEQSGVLFAGDGTWVALTPGAGGSDHADVVIVALPSCKEVARLKAADLGGRLIGACPYGVAVSADGASLAIARAREGVEIYDTKTWSKRQTIGAVTAASAVVCGTPAFSPDAKQLLVVDAYGRDGSLYALATGTRTVHRQWRWSPAGHLPATTGETGLHARGTFSPISWTAAGLYAAVDLVEIAELDPLTLEAKRLLGGTPPLDPWFKDDQQMVAGLTVAPDGGYALVSWWHGEIRLHSLK